MRVEGNSRTQKRSKMKKIAAKSDDDEPLGFFIKSRKSQKSKIVPSRENNNDSVKNIASSMDVGQQISLHRRKDLVGMDDTLASFRKRRKGSTIDSRSGAIPSQCLAASAVEDLRTASESKKDSDLTIDDESCAQTARFLENRPSYCRQKHQTCDEIRQPQNHTVFDVTMSQNRQERMLTVINVPNKPDVCGRNEIIPGTARENLESITCTSSQIFRKDTFEFDAIPGKEICCAEKICHLEDELKRCSNGKGIGADHDTAAVQSPCEHVSESHFGDAVICGGTDNTLACQLNDKLLACNSSTDDKEICGMVPHEHNFARFDENHLQQSRNQEDNAIEVPSKASSRSTMVEETEFALDHLNQFQANLHEDLDHGMVSLQQEFDSVSASKGIINESRDNNSFSEAVGEGSQLLSASHSKGIQRVAGFVPDKKSSDTKLLTLQRAVRKVKKRRHGDMAYEGDADWDRLLHRQGFLASSITANMSRSRYKCNTNMFRKDEACQIAAISAGLRVRTVGSVEKIKFKDIFRCKGGVQEFLECRNHILSLWSKDVSRILLLEDCGVTEMPSKHEPPQDYLMREVYKFLDYRGYINIGIAGSKQKIAGDTMPGYKILEEQNFIQTSQDMAHDADDGASFIIDQVKNSDACNVSQKGHVTDKKKLASNPGEGNRLSAADTTDFLSLSETENCILDGSHGNVLRNEQLRCRPAESDVFTSSTSYGVAYGEATCLGTMEVKNEFPSTQSERNDCNRRTVIIIGAGPAGLTAARHLQRQGFHVTVLEGRNRIGGRVYTDRKSLSVPVDLGASIITGVEADVSTERRPDPSSLICAQLGLELTLLNSNCPLYDIVTGQKVPTELDEALEAEYNSLLDEMLLIVAQRGEDAMRMSLEDGLEYALRRRRMHCSGKASKEKPSKEAKLHYSTESAVESIKSTVNEPESNGCIISNTQFLTPLERRVMDWHFANLEYGCAASLQGVSLPYWNQDDAYGGFGGAHCMIKGGYSAVIEHLGHGIPIYLNHNVTKIVYKNGDGVIDDCRYKSRVITSEGVEFVGDAVLVTVPLGCLKAESIMFSPPLPQWKTSSIHRLGFGVLNKIVLEFTDVFWDNTLDYFGATALETDQRGHCFMFWNVNKTVGAPVLIALVVGKVAMNGQNMNSDDHVKHALMVLRKLFGDASISDLVASVVTDWGRDPFSRGAYSYVAVGASGEDYDILSRPVDNCLFFAGEATCKEHPDTVGGAMISGLREAVRIIDILNTGNDYTGDVEAVEDANRHSDRERNEIRDIMMRLDAVEFSNSLHMNSLDGTGMVSTEILLQDMFYCAKTTGGRLIVAKELLGLPIDALKSFAGTQKGLGVLNSWILDSLGKDGTQLLRHCVRVLVLVSTDLLAVRLSGIGKTIKEKVCVHTSRDIRAIAAQLVSMWVEVFRMKKASGSGFKLPRKGGALHLLNGNPSKNHASRQHLQHVPLDAKENKKEKAITEERHSPSENVELSGESFKSVDVSEEEKAAFAAAEAARITALAAAEAYASSEGKCSPVPLPKIPSFHKFARRDQYAQMEEYAKRKWPGGPMGGDCLSEIDSRNCRVRNWSLDFSAACVNLGNSRTSVDNLSQQSHSNEVSCPSNLQEHSGESAAADSSVFTKAWVDAAGSIGIKDHHAIEKWQSQASEANPDIFSSTIPVLDDGDTSTIPEASCCNKDDSVANVEKSRLIASQPRGPEKIKQAVVDFVATLLMPLYKTRKLDKEGYKSIMKKTATKVMEQATNAEKAMVVYAFLDLKRKNKIRALVDILIERQMKSVAKNPCPKI